MVEGVEQIRFEHARTSHSDQIACFLSRAWPQAQPATRDRVRGHIGKDGLLKAKDGEEVVGVLGFQVENLVARVTDDFLILPDHFDDDARGAPLSTMEEMARDVRCEAEILLAGPDAPADTHAFWQSFGHEVREIAGLPSNWQEATRDFHLCGHDRPLVKRLRANPQLARSVKGVHRCRRL